MVQIVNNVFPHREECFASFFRGTYVPHSKNRTYYYGTDVLNRPDRLGSDYRRQELKHIQEPLEPTLPLINTFKSPVLECVFYL